MPVLIIVVHVFFLVCKKNIQAFAVNFMLLSFTFQWHYGNRLWPTTVLDGHGPCTYIIVPGTHTVSFITLLKEDVLTSVTTVAIGMNVCAQQKGSGYRDYQGV